VILGAPYKSNFRICVENERNYENFGHCRFKWIYSYREDTYGMAEPDIRIVQACGVVGPGSENYQKCTKYTVPKIIECRKTPILHHELYHYNCINKGLWNGFFIYFIYR
jgi:hypothetical protein